MPSHLRPLLLALAAAQPGLAAPTGLRGAAVAQPPVYGSDADYLPQAAVFSDAAVDTLWDEEGAEQDQADENSTDDEQLQEMARFGPPAHTDKVKVESKTCADPINAGCGGCYLYRKCRAHSSAACVINGYLVVAGAPLRGMEDISGKTAGSWDFLWKVAQGRCGSSSCVLITNPVKYRSQHQMHIHFRRYNSGGAAMKTRLEKALCGTSGWHHFDQCGGAKARLYDHTPAVFSEVAAAYGGGSLADVGITVWFTDACGGGRKKTILLATTRCSIEHGISNGR